MEFHLPQTIIETSNFSKETIKYIKNRQLTNIFLLYSSSGLKQEKLETFINQSLESGLKVEPYVMEKGEPTFEFLQNVLLEMDALKSEVIVAIGGGSTIDLAKAAAAIAMDSKQQFKQFATYTTIKRLPLIAIPTTAGTGSEATKIAVITDSKEQIKYNPSHPDLIPDVAILDATLIATLPMDIMAQTALDALTHAIEAYVSSKANAWSNMYALEAIKLITSSINNVFEKESVEAHRNLLRGSFYAGVAFSNASTNLAHATGRPLGSKFHLPHGLSVALMHPFVVRLNYSEARQKYEVIERVIGLKDGQSLREYLMQLNTTLNIWGNGSILLEQHFEESIPELATNALNGNGIVTNPIIPSKLQVEQLFHDMYDYLQSVHSIQS